MVYEWDEQKAAQNIAKHGVPFDYAARVFLDAHRLDSEDDRRDYGEKRRLVLGEIEGRLFYRRLHHARQNHSLDFRTEG